MRHLALTAALLAIVLHSGPAASDASKPAPLIPIEALDVPRYMGRWYEVAKFPNWFQRQCVGDTSAEYRLLGEGRVSVLNRCRRESGRIDEAVGEARQIGAADSPRLQVCLDTCHTFAAGYELRTPEGVEATMRAFDDAIGVEHLAVVHANDSKTPLGGLRDRHDNIGDGHIGADGFRAILGHPAFAGKAFLLEVPGLPTEAKPKGDGPDVENINRLKAIRDEVTK